jgi:4-hydroxymandelate oxidase
VSTQPAPPAGSGRTFYASAARFATLGEIADAARAALPADVWDFLAGGAGTETTLADNAAAFGRWRFRPRVLSGIGPPDLGTSLLGIPLRLPLLTAPFGADGLFHPDGQLAVARANARAGIASIVPEAGTYPLEEVATAAPAAARVLQLHPMGPERNFRDMLARAEDAGYTAVCLTADSPTGGWRERNLRNRFSPDPAVITGNYPPGRGVSPEQVFGQLFTRGEPVWSWDQVARLCATSRLPFLVKGILTAADARAAVAAGAAAVLVSNHGGRQLDRAPAALDQLPEVVAEVGGEVPVALDSGVRSGTDVVVALALGADAVVIGRLAAYGLAADGEAGVTRVLELLREEITTVLTLLGRPSVRDLDPTALQPADRR